MSVAECVAAATNSGSDTLSGFHDIQVITRLVADGLVTRERVDLAAPRLLEPLFMMALFEGTYVDEGAADDVLADEQREFVALLGSPSILRGRFGFTKETIHEEAHRQPAGSHVGFRSGRLRH